MEINWILECVKLCLKLRDSKSGGCQAGIQFVCWRDGDGYCLQNIVFGWLILVFDGWLMTPGRVAAGEARLGGAGGGAGPVQPGRGAAVQRPELPGGAGHQARQPQPRHAHLLPGAAAGTAHYSEVHNAVVLQIHRGAMQHLWDHEGRRYLDMFGGIVTVSVGHCHPAVTEALTQQINTLWHTTNIYLHPKVVNKVKESQQHDS